MRYEWDAQKNEANILKHRLDFEDAFRVFLGDFSLEFDDRFDYGEDRWKATGLLNEVVVTVVFTEPDENTRRVISMRKATLYERNEYAQFLRDNFPHGLGIPEEPAG